jgi:hypothetical protein
MISAFKKLGTCPYTFVILNQWEGIFCISTVKETMVWSQIKKGNKYFSLLDTKYFNCGV